ncbi:MAG: hypothetical protein ABIJ08_01895, partial [Nanoarchaeota archaeon]
NPPIEFQSFFGYKLSDGTDMYEIGYQFSYVNEYRSYWHPEIRWEIKFNSNLISEGRHSTVGYGDLERHELRGIKDGVLENFLRELEGLDHYNLFMDCRELTVESLNDQDSYDKKIYTVMMAHLNERGLLMPPIMGDDSELFKHMDKGDIGWVDKKVRAMVAYHNRVGDGRLLSHLEAESDIIMEYTLRRRDERDPVIPLVEKFGGFRYKIIEGEHGFKYQILVVETNVRSTSFTDRVERSLKNDGRYGGTTLITEACIHPCMLACGTGQVDLVLFDWVRPDWGELMYTGLRPDKPLFEQLNIRNKWMEYMARECKKEGVDVPPHYIVMSGREYGILNGIVSQALGDPLPIMQGRELGQQRLLPN